MTIPATTIDAIRSLQKHVGDGNRARGFREDEELLDTLTGSLGDAINVAEESLSETGQPQDIRLTVSTARDLLKTLKNAKVHGQANRLILGISELIEAHDEIRSGHAVTETYYNYVGGDDRDDDAPSRDRFDKPRKPEGVPSEIADTFIRTLDFADTYDIDLAAIIEEKDAYNATRPFKHGRKF